MKKDFVWGAGTAAYQVEGAYLEDGRGLSIWDEFSHLENNITRNHNGDVACDHYHLYAQDVKLMKKLGINSYRFSISWSRILPDGTGKINEKGFEFYDHLLDELEKDGIEPYVTLYHWDLPLALYNRGGWVNPEIVTWFEYYTDVVTKHFKNRIKNYITINEPQCIVQVGMRSDEHAPGKIYSISDCLKATHNILLSHGHSVQKIRENVKNAKVGIATCSNIAVPSSNDKNVVEAARKMYFVVPKDEFYTVSLFSDPIFLGDYPKEYYQIYKDVLPKITPEDLKIISTPLDFCYQNIYSGVYIGIDKNMNGYVKEFPIGSPQSNIFWGDVVPESLYWGPKFLYERYHKPIIISENGVCCHDVISKDGKVHDPNRIDFMDRYLCELKRASSDGVDIRGYFAWTLMDNFEWKHGYTKRFGLIYVDYATQKRIVKDSFRYYKKVISSNGEILK